MGFSKDFLWGAAAASAQIEGGWKDGGRTPSIWDMATKKQVKHGETCHTACDHYHRWKEDVALMKEMGLKSYRFSISWSRVIPEEGKVNPEGLKFYSDLVDELIANGIEPLVTIFHWDLPMWVYKKGGWLSEGIVPLFREYTKVVVEALSDRVKWWMTINEPGCFIMNGYMQGAHAPFKHDYLALSRLSRNCMLAHAASVKAIRQYAKQPVKVGIAFSTGAWVPENETPAEIEKARKLSVEEGNGLMGNRWWMDPILLGKPVTAYCVYATHKSDMPRFKTDFDFLAVNHYEAFNYSAWGGDKSIDKSKLNTTSLGWVIDGRSIYWTLKFLYRRYRLPIIITENGMANNDSITDGEVRDDVRIGFMNDYLSNVRRAIDDGVKVFGYQHWSLMDNFEWAEGYEPRFGLIYVDYKTLKRTPKNSAYHYKKIIETNGEIIP